MPKLFQAGRFGSGDIRARRFVIEGSHLVADAGWSPRLGLVLDVAFYRSSQFAVSNFHGPVGDP
jgi:hypothetical protein